MENNTRRNYLINGTITAKGHCYAPDREYTYERDFCALKEENAIRQFVDWVCDFCGLDKEEIVKVEINDLYCNGKEKRGARIIRAL